MKKREVPVFLFTGFLESGKTSFIKDSLNDRGFFNGEKTLIILCEEGEIEYDEVACSKRNIFFEKVEEQESLTAEFYRKCDDLHKPERVMVEYNGMWQLDPVLDDNMPDEWEIVQVISTVDATTFPMYWSNMRQLVMEQLSLSDLVILNRCTDQTKRNDFRRSIKLFNKKAQIGYEAAEGYEDALKEEQLPFDIDAPVIDIEDDDYGIWYMDIMDNPRKYDGKKVRFNALVFRPKNYPDTSFVPGRFAMTCCADDIQYMGIICKGAGLEGINDKDWVTVTACVKREFAKEYRGKGPVLYASDVEKGIKPEDDLVYF